VTTDYTDPRTIDVDEVLANINMAFRLRAHTWTDEPTWPNVTVKALADEIGRLRAENDQVDKASYVVVRVPGFLRRQGA
jgi:hypothetical protein